MTPRTPGRESRILEVLSRRQPDLRVVLEDIANAHNANAVLRTCDAAGVLHVHVVGGASLPINSAVTTRADKWLDIQAHPDASDCLRRLKSGGFQIVVTDLGDDARPHSAIDYTRPTAIVFGNEREGVTAAAREWADARIKIPMLGMAQSLNLSVSAGVILYEAVRQRLAAGFYDARRLSDADFEAARIRWLDL